MSLMLLEKAKNKVSWPKVTFNTDTIKWHPSAGLVAFVGFTEAEAEKPVCEWKPEGVAVASLPPLVTVEEVKGKSLLMRWTEAAHAVITEAGDNHICTPRLVTGGLGAGATFAMRYIHEGAGDCIVGRVLQKMGVEASTIAAMEGNGADHLVINLFADEPDVQQVATVARYMQMVNDSSQPWGRAREYMTLSV